MIPPAVFAQILHWMAVPLAVWCTIASLELLAVRSAFRPGGALGSDLTGLVRGRMTPAILGSRAFGPRAFGPRAFGPRAFGIVAALRLAAGIALPVAGGASAAVLLVVLGCTILLSIASGGGDGADKIALVACTAALLIALGLLLGDRLLCLAGLVWGAGQAVIAYVTSGAAKFASRIWRDGSAFAAAMTSYRSGHSVAAAIVRRRPAALVLAWGVMLVETLFPLALVAPQPVCLAILATLGAFHVATAIVMGLNTYPYAFIATYPCIMAANAIIVGP